MISIVITLRNDDHGLNMIERVDAFLWGLDTWRTELGLDIELIVVEWNPPDDMPLLHEVLDTRGIPTTYYVVPKEIHYEFCNAEFIRLYQMIAKNVGIRRAKGDWVLATNPDLLFTRELADALRSEALDLDCYYRVPRYDVSARLLPIEKGMDYCIQLCANNIIRLRTNKPENLAAMACGDFTLAPQSAWRALRAYPEWPIWSIHIDGVFLHMLYTYGLQERVLRNPERAYHIEHENTWARYDDPEPFSQPKMLHRPHYLPIITKMLDDESPWIVNDQNWGLADCDEVEIAPNVIQLEGGTRPSQYAQWISVLSMAQNRRIYRDQTVSSLSMLASLVQDYEPDVIIELGTASGLSFRTWVDATLKTDTRIVTVDRGMKALELSMSVLPVKIDTPERVSLIQRDALAMDFSLLYRDTDKVLFYIDIHGELAMAYLLINTVERLPPGSLVIVDDLWYSEKRLGLDNVEAFFIQTVLPDIDPEVVGPRRWAHYWKGGSFFGFDEVIPLMAWLGKNKVELGIVPGAKLVYFEVQDE
jgi:predicted O-methyltransferase YrrM